MDISKNSGNKILKQDLIFMAILLLYPMRHIHWGLDLWDTGYNYANFTYMGLEHMDSMWLFSTYLSTAVGHFLTLLPGAGTLMGMNFYTGLFASALAAIGYCFCVGKLGILRWVAFAGEFLALSLCWCPTALLYNYITYVLFLVCVILLYIGLTEKRMGCLFAAGVCLGCNVLVRFSNLPEAAMIVAVWAWDIIVWRERRERKLWPEILRHTLWCLGGYLAALAVLFGYIHIRYGLGSYIAGIQRLFAMTDNAEDYKASSMLMGMLRMYVGNLYWVARFAVILAVGVAGFAVVKLVAGAAGRRSGESAERYIWTAAKLLWCGGAVLVLFWLYRNRAYSFHYYSYDSMVVVASLFLTLILLIGAVRTLQPGVPTEEKLLSGMVILVVLLTSIGSNNGIYPSLNNLFLAGPYAFWECWKLIKGVKDQLSPKINIFPVKVILAVFLALLLVQSAAFGACFLFEEATGARGITSVINNNKVLKGIRMNPERARWMSELTAYIEENGLQGREVILFGQVPALSFYLRMPSAFNPWSDLRSYSYETMDKDLRELSAELEETGAQRPLIIMDSGYVQQYEWYLEGGDESLSRQGVDENRCKWIAETANKYLLLRAFEKKFNYDLTFVNEKFVVYE